MKIQLWVLRLPCFLKVPYFFTDRRMDRNMIRQPPKIRCLKNRFVLGFYQMSRIKTSHKLTVAPGTLQKFYYYVNYLHNLKKSSFNCVKIYVQISMSPYGSKTTLNFSLRHQNSHCQFQWQRTIGSRDGNCCCKFLQTDQIYFHSVSKTFWNFFPTTNCFFWWTAAYFPKKQHFILVTRY